MNKLEELKLAYRRTFNTEDGQRGKIGFGLRPLRFLAIHMNKHLTKDNEQLLCKSSECCPKRRK
jgi:hypothetical protein